VWSEAKPINFGKGKMGGMDKRVCPWISRGLHGQAPGDERPPVGEWHSLCTNAQEKM